MIDAIIGLGAALVIVVAAWLAGKRVGKSDASAKQAKAADATKKEITDAIETSRRDGADWRNRLRDSDR